MPDELRAEPDRRHDLLAAPDIAAAIGSRRAALLDARRKWLVA